MSIEREEALLDLLVKQATVGLTEEESRELKQLDTQGIGSIDGPAFELAAAALSIASLDKFEPMPQHVEARILLDADRFFAEQSSPVAAASSAAEKRPTADENTQGWSVWNWLPWGIAAAASVALAVNVATDNPTPTLVQQPTPQVEQKLTPAQERDQLLASARDVIKATWAPGNVKEIVQIGGEVVWSDEKQAGYMTFKGLPANDPNKETYQLWIFEENQGDKTPIDGGVFDVNANGEVIVPISAKLKAKNPALFAITIEKPGGVVVSKREKIAAAAKIEAPKTSA
ncbi:MAG: anti-sigma factor [Acidobacteria bacterium]|nr:anti-sigma factor [Acidobacteriota bacterium]